MLSILHFSPITQNKMTMRLLLLPYFLLLCWSCKEKEPATPQQALIAKAGPPQEVLVGESVQLDGSDSSDPEGKPFTYSWSFTGIPQGSAATLTHPTTAKPTFIPDKAGEYTVEISIENARGKARDNVLIKATVSQPLELTGPVNIPTVLVNRISNPDFPDYVILSDVLVRAELQIEPGVVIAVARDKRLEIAADGMIKAVGTTGDPIRFTGMESTKGFWSGILIRSASSANELDHVMVEYAGSKALDATIKAGLLLNGGEKAQLSLRNSSFIHNDGYGVYLQPGAGFRNFAHNDFMHNTLSGLAVDADNAAKIDAGSSFAYHNGRNTVDILSSILNPDGIVTWNRLDEETAYRIHGVLTINAHLKLAPGTLLEVERDGNIVVTADARFEAKGTAADSIRIRGAQPAAGYWKGLICYSPSNVNTIEYAEVSGAGSIALVSGKKANIAVYGTNAAFSIRNSKINKSGGYGVFVNYQASINADFETANTFEGNQQANLLRE